MILLEHFIYLEKKRFVFVPVPKAACTNWKALLRHLSGFADYLDSGLAHDKQKNGLVYLSGVTEWRRILDDPTIAKYCFVRNPYTRVLSAYLNKLEPLTRGSGEWLGPYFRMVYKTIEDYRKQSGRSDASVSFGAFLDWLAHSGHECVTNEHWLSQSRILAPSMVEYDFVGRFENLRGDAALLMGRMGCDAPFPTQEALDFPGTNSARLMGTYYTNSEVDLVQEIYRNDFESFAYPLILPTTQ
jgi:hypothetical protein